VLQSVTQSGNQVVFTFKAPSVPYFYYVGDQIPIVPEHIWSTIANPVTYADSNPIGTGAFMVQSCTPQNITYVANPHYWQPGLPKVAKVLYPAFTSNDPARRSGAASSSRTSRPSTPRSRPTTTTGSRRSRTCP